MRVLKITLATLFVLVICCPLFACGGIGGAKNTYELYLDYNTNETDTYTFAIECSEWGHTNIDVDFDIAIKNITIKTLTFRFHSAKLVRESTGAEYSVGSFFGEGFEKITLESDLTEEEEFSSTIPTSYKTEKYRFEISLNKDRYIFYLYEKPDELRAKHTVSYSVNGEIVRTEEVADGRTPSLEGYEDLENSIKCRAWFFDSEFRNQVNGSFKIKENITVYGKLIDIFEVNTYWQEIEKINFIPACGEIVIPKVYNGFYIKSLDSYCFGRSSDELKGLKTIYIPKGITIYSYFSYCPDLGTVYYEGTEKEWNSACWHKPPTRVKVVFNTYKES